MLDEFGIFHSDFQDVEISNLNAWQYLYPAVKKWNNLSAFVLAKTGESITFQEALERSLCWAKELKNYFNGLTPPIVALVLSTHPDCLPIVWGCFAIGAPICLLNCLLVEDIFLLMISQAKPNLIVFDSVSYEKFKNAIELSGINPVIFIRDDSGISTKNLNDVLYSEDKLNIKEAGQYDSSSTALITYSSGTTGKPKAILLSHTAITNSIACIANTLPLNTTDNTQESILVNYSFDHVFPMSYYMLWIPLMGCRSIAVPSAIESQYLSYIDKYKPKLITTRPELIQILSNLDLGDKFDSVKFISIAGTSPNYESFKKLNSKVGFKLTLLELYGCSECNAMVVSSLEHNRLGMTGKLIPNSFLRFVDLQTNLNITEPNKIGELFYKGPGLMDGYLNVETNKNAIDANGWFPTGDIGYFDEDHFVKIIERFSDLITVKINGENIKVSPSMIEEKIKEHPSIIDCGVIGVPDCENEEEIPKAFIISENPLKAEEIHKFLEQRTSEEMRLGGGIVFVDNLPRNHMGKLVRKYLREMAWFKKN